MSRLIPGTVSVILFGCVAVALLASDEAPSSGSLRSVLKRNAAPPAVPAPAATVPAPSAPPTPAQTAVAPAAPAAPAATSAAPAEPEDVPADSTGSKPAPFSAERNPAGTSGAAEGPLTGPQSSAAPRAFPDDEMSSPRVSSRRTQRPQIPSSTPNGVAAKPVPTQRVDPAPLTDGSAQTAIDSPLTLAKSIGPALRVDVVGPAAAMLGEEATFKVHLLNQGEAEARGITVRIGVPDSARVVGSEAGAGDARVQTDSVPTQVVWTLDRLQAQAASGLTLRLVPVASRPIELAVDWSAQPSVSTARIEVKQSLLEMTLGGPNEMVFGDTKVFSIMLANPGTGDARNVAVNVSLGPNTSDTMNVGTIPAGTSKNFDFEVTARQTGTMQIAATATGAGNMKQEAVHQVSVQRAELAVEASGPSMEFAGSVANYSVSVTNRGNAAARNVQVLVRMPTGVRYLQGEGNVRPEATGLVWQLGDLTPGTERTFRFDCELVSDGDMPFQVAARADGGLEMTDDLTTRVEAVADLKLTVNDPKGPIPVGQDVVYEISIMNRGTKAAAQVQVVAQFSEGIEPVATDGMPGEIQAGQVVFQPIARINSKETIKLTVKAKAQTDGIHVFRAAVQCSDPETRLVAEDTTRFYGSSPMRRTDNPGLASPSDRGQDPARVGETPPAPAAGIQR